MTQHFDVGYDDTFFMADEPGLELTSEECAALTQRMKARGLLLAPIVAVSGFATHADDSSCDGEVKCFVTVTLRVTADSVDEAEGMDVPVQLLKAIVADVSDEVDRGREDNWNLLSAELAS